MQHEEVGQIGERIALILRELAELIDKLCIDSAQNVTQKESRIAQLSVVMQSIRDLERRRVDVPEDLRRLKAGLAVEVSCFDEANRIFDDIKMSLNRCVGLVEAQLPTRKRRKRREKSNFDTPVASKSIKDLSYRSSKKSSITVYQALEQVIVSALKSLGGSAKRKEVVDWIISHQQELPEAHRMLSRKAIESNAVNARSKLVVKRILRADSQHGLWELR